MRVPSPARPHSPSPWLAPPTSSATHPGLGGCGAVSGRPQHHSRGTWAPRLPGWGCPGSRPPSMAWSPARPSRRASAGWPGSRSLGEELTFGKMTSQAPHQHELVPGSVAWWPEASRDLAATLLLGLTSPRQMGSCAPSPPLGGPPTPRRGEAPTAPLSLPPHASFIVYHVLGSGTHQVLTQQVTRHRNWAHGTHTGCQTHEVPGQQPGHRHSGPTRAQVHLRWGQPGGPSDPENTVWSTAPRSRGRSPGRHPPTGGGDGQQVAQRTGTQALKSPTESQSGLLSTVPPHFNSKGRGVRRVTCCPGVF